MSDLIKNAEEYATIGFHLIEDDYMPRKKLWRYLKWAFVMGAMYERTQKNNLK